MFGDKQKSIPDGHIRGAIAKLMCNNAPDSEIRNRNTRSLPLRLQRAARGVVRVARHHPGDRTQINPIKI